VNDVEELKQFIVVHARAQQLPPARYRPVLDRIVDDGPGTPGSWVREWSQEGRRAEEAGDLLDACRYYNIARFPFVDGPARQQALDQCVQTFDRWRTDHGDVERLDVDLPAGRVRCWATGLDQPGSARTRPLLLVLGGIVSIKEQWAPVLIQATRLGVAGVVAEMPGVGENTLPYDENSPEMISAILDAVGGRADVSQTYLVALSFSGHLALRAATTDPRIRGVITAGVPVSEFFTDEIWQQTVPRVTVATLGHLTGQPQERVLRHLRSWALTPGELEKITVPVACLSSRRDEIIPPGEQDLLRRYVNRLSLVANDDVHGSPDHVLESRVWVLLSLLRMRGDRSPARALLGTLWRLLRLRGFLRRR
jgi:esterase FrsA